MNTVILESFKDLIAGFLTISAALLWTIKNLSGKPFASIGWHGRVESIGWHG